MSLSGYQRVRSRASDLYPFGLPALIVMVALVPATTWAQQVVPGRVTVIKPGTLAKFVAKPAAGQTFTMPSANPSVAGGSLRMSDAGATAGDDTYPLLPGTGWKGLGAPAGSKGYKYKGAGTTSDPCRVALVKPTVIKSVCKGDAITLAPPFTGNVSVVLDLGGTDRYCASFGGDEVRNDERITKRKNAAAPATCPSAGVCGNGTVQSGEQCDDGNVAPLDGCSATCQLEVGDVAGNCSLDAAPAAIVSLGSSPNVLLRGCIVTPSDSFDGEVLVVGDALACVAADCSSDPGAATATVVETHGIVLPGLIDAHNHVLFDIFDETDWTPTQTYTNHNDWPNEARFGAMIDAQQYLTGQGSSPVDVACEVNKFGELKGLVAGTTSIVGAAVPANLPCYGSLARTIDQSPNDLGDDKIQVATMFPSTASADGVCTNFADGDTDAYLVHVGEGTDTAALEEFDDLYSVSTTAGCLYAAETTIVHGIPFGSTQFETMAAHGMGLIWSPRSNVFLYGGGTDLTKTTNIPLARSKGINVSLAPDWSIGGSQNMLDELRFANTIDDTIWGNVLTSKDLVLMATQNAAQVLGLSATLGSLSVGKKADIFVIGGNRAYPWSALLAAHPSDVRLVMVNGVALYGDDAIGLLGGASPGCEAIDVCTKPKFACVAESGGTPTNKLGQTFAQISTAISTELANYDAFDVSPWDFAPMTPLVRCP